MTHPVHYSIFSPNSLPFQSLALKSSWSESEKHDDDDGFENDDGGMSDYKPTFIGGQQPKPIVDVQERTRLNQRLWKNHQQSGHLLLPCFGLVFYDYVQLLSVWKQGQKCVSKLWNVLSRDRLREGLEVGTRKQASSHFIETYPCNAWRPTHLVFCLAKVKTRCFYFDCVTL